MGIREKDIENQILNWLNRQPKIFAFKINTVGVYDQKLGIYRKNFNRYIIPGTSDILGIAYERFIAIEVKTPESIKVFNRSIDKPALNQKNFIQKVNAMGGHGTVVCSLDDVMTFIASLKSL